jgi:hypothetical protein
MRNYVLRKMRTRSPCFLIRCLQLRHTESYSAALAATSVPDSLRTICGALKLFVKVAGIRSDAFHGDKTGSNPVGDTNKIKD